jgi:hypothetical protein
MGNEIQRRLEDISASVDEVKTSVGEVGAKVDKAYANVISSQDRGKPNSRSRDVPMVFIRHQPNFIEL